MNKTKDTVIEVKDFYGDQCLVDQVNANISKARRPQGEVHIFEETDNDRKELIYKSNLVIYRGREMLAQRLVNENNTDAQAVYSDFPTKDEYVCWFALGDGGVRPADPLDPVPPINSDDYIYSPVPLIDSTTPVYANYHIAGDPYSGPSGSYPADGFYAKRFDTDGIEFYADNLNDDRYLILQITTTIGVNDANGYQLSEAGLLSAESRSGSYSGQFSLFARVTFPSLVKTGDRRLVFVWYLYV
jgi:hypothetical protein